MTLHLIKLCVGADSVEDLRQWVENRAALAVAAGLPAQSSHVTRMVPKRRDELLDGGSLYWIIKGQIAARQQLLDLKTLTGADGITRCELVLAPEVIDTAMVPRRPFQGWRYLDPDAAPRDLASSGQDLSDMPEALKRELAELGLL
ncbi:DUF1489 family protein [Peteryoungia desertarenae]|uniref:DUF1489 family protein n=1 Tax=Peteryoungia desertarenae TaxID=1813451 RepID=A0ABX6QQM2_9HYPH|nr:DUF1489 family protein [Peteryoungia desertarenae]QLF70552.1 DUF1489 family protein [Peteryoungia desertarenae]